MARQLWRGVVFACITFCMIISHAVAQGGDKILIIHGGAGTITPAHGTAKKVAMLAAIRAGYAALQTEDDAQLAVIEAIKVMEDSPAFNAGTGSVRSASGEVEMDAIIINGTDLGTGAVGAVRHIKNPITLARLVKDTSEHVFLVGYQAELFALNSNQMNLVPTSSLIANWTTSNEGWTSNHPRKQNRAGTVGAVAVNSRGQIFAGTSTGGLSGKMDGRVGDTPIVGAGTLADDEIGGISATGWGEAFIRYRVASRIAGLMEGGMNASMSISTVLSGMASRIQDADGGAIAIGKNGDIGFEWNSEQMAWAYSKGVDIHYGVDRGEDINVPLDDSVSTG
ncbi:isoaspartyl peptidase/L-asparaginase isoform X2 [Folsomia candida]|nr:isoaspartyl peptidase/L-asparaginase isoform X2 [Folsomia candida]